MITESYLTITCKCGHEADFMEFRTTPITGDLPKDHYQCPTCRRAWKIEMTPARIGWSGMPLPGGTQIIGIPATL